jgi:hypothetical protein
MRSILALVLVVLGVVCIFGGVVGFFLAYAAFFRFGDTPVSAWAVIGPVIGALGAFVGAACVFPWATRARSVQRG